MFTLVRPLPGILPAVQIRNVLVAGVLLWALALYLGSRRERWLR